MSKASRKQKIGNNKSIYLEIWRGERRAWFASALRSGNYFPGKDFCFVSDEALVSRVLLPVGKFYSQSPESPTTRWIGRPSLQLPGSRHCDTSRQRFL